MTSENAIIIVFNPRTGSSLLAQTLRLLGKPVLGNHETNTPLDANPKGFLDIREIRDKGLSPEIRKAYAGQLENHAYKILISPFLDESNGHWAWMKEVKPVLLLTFRNPLEQVLSDNAIFQKKKAGTTAFFMQVTNGLKHWEKFLRTFSSTIKKKCPELCLNTHLVDYREHIEDPRKYVRRIAAVSGLTPNRDHFRAAYDNIDPCLYRFKYQQIESEYKQWYSKFNCSAFYEQLKKNPQAIWGN